LPTPITEFWIVLRQHKGIRIMSMPRMSSFVPEEQMARAKEVVEQHPMSALATVFFVGFGVGLFVGCALAEPMRHDPTAAERAERVGRQMLDALARVVPDSLAARLHV
jgi:hypothetical protein